MKHQLETVAIPREPIPRKVKKIRSVAPSKFQHWNLLPNEIKATIVQKMDVATSILFSECGRNELELVRNHTRNLVDISLLFFEWNGRNIMEICVRSAGSETDQLCWSIQKGQFGDTEVKHCVMSSSPKPQTLILDGKSVDATFYMILRRLLSAPMFVVNKLELRLRDYSQKFELESTKANIGLLRLTGCYNSEPVLSMLKNNNLNFKNVVGTIYKDRRILYKFDISTYGRPRTIPSSSPFPDEPNGFNNSFLSTHGPRWYEEAYERLKGFWDITLGLYNFVNTAAVNRKLELRKTTDDIMILRAAYYYNDNCVPYIQNGEDNAEDIVYAYSDRITFLKDGIDDHLSDYQLTVLSIAYLVRLFRDEPEIEKIHDIAFEDLKLVLKKFENVNLYEKLVGKLEALLP